MRSGSLDIDDGYLRVAANVGYSWSSLAKSSADQTIVGAYHLGLTGSVVYSVRTAASWYGTPPLP